MFFSFPWEAVLLCHQIAKAKVIAFNNCSETKTVLSLTSGTLTQTQLDHLLKGSALLSFLQEIIKKSLFFYGRSGDSESTLTSSVGVDVQEEEKRECCITASVPVAPKAYYFMGDIL